MEGETYARQNIRRVVRHFGKMAECDGAPANYGLTCLRVIERVCARDLRR